MKIQKGFITWGIILSLIGFLLFKYSYTKTMEVGTIYHWEHKHKSGHLYREGISEQTTFQWITDFLFSGGGLGGSILLIGSVCCLLIGFGIVENKTDNDNEFT